MNMFGRLATAGVVVGGLIAAGAFVANAGLRPTATPASAGVNTTLLTTGTGPATPGTSGRFGSGRGGPRGGFGRYGGFGFAQRGGGLTVTSVSTNTITAKGRGGQTITVQVSATTAYTEAGASASLSDIHTGSIIAVRGSYAATGNTINATAITIVLPQEAGVVTSVNGDTLTLTGFDGATHTVTVTGSTRYQKAGASAVLSAITPGTAIVAAGTLDSTGTLTALRVTIQEPRVAGQVTAVSGASYTVAGRFGSTYTVNATGSTTYLNPDGTAASASAVKSGTYIVAQGTLSADGKTLSAQRIVVVPVGSGRGYGRHGGFGFHRRGFGAGGMGSWNGGANGGAPGATAPTTTGAGSLNV